MFNKKVQDLTVMESLKISSIVTLICLIPTIVGMVAFYWEDIIEGIRCKFRR